MFGFYRSKKAEVLQHWIAFVEGVQFVPTDFYNTVEEELRVRQVPGLEMARVEFAEGGVLSDKRLYLRMLRERLVFDVCAAPFGKAFFFSCRMAEIPLVVKLWQLLVLAAGIGLALILSLKLLIGLFGPGALLLCPILWLVFLVAAIYTMRNAVAMGLKDLDTSLLNTPVLGRIYEAWFRKESYYRHDTRLMYLEVVSSLVKRLAEESVAVKGVKLTTQYELGHIFGELYKPLPNSPREAKVE